MTDPQDAIEPEVDQEVVEDQREAARRLLAAEREFQELELFKTGHFMASHPYPVEKEIFPPVKEELTFLKMMGTAAIGFVLSGIGSVVFSAIRTAAIFAAAEYALLVELFPQWKGNLALSWVASAFVLAAVELFLASWGYNKGIQSGRLNENPWAFRIAFTIAALAGVLSAFGIVGEGALETWMKDTLAWLLLAISGFGIPVIITIGTENLGFLHNAWKKKVRDIYQAYDASVASAHAIYIIEIREWSELLEREFFAKRSKIFGNRKVERAPVVVTKKKANVSLAQLVSQWLLDHGLDAYDVGPDKAVQPSQIAIELGADPGNVRTALSRLRKP